MALHGKEHVARYQATDGAEGHDWNGTVTLLLTTNRHRSGGTYTTPVIYQRYGDEVLVVASKGGAPEHPDWYRNLLADPHAQVQILGDRFAAVARTATPAEKAERWPTMTATWPDFDNYQKRTDRDIPLVILERA